FRLPAAQRQLQGGAVVASAEGLCPDWAEVPAGKPGELTLKLSDDDLPVRGRVLSLEGKPLPGVRVEVLGVMKNPGGDLTHWVDGVKKGYWYQWRRMPPRSLGLPGSVMTDKEGRFRLVGVGRERVVWLRVTGPGIEFAFFQVMTRNGPAPARG